MARWLPLALIACGTWSNEDFEYVLSLPPGEAVRSNLVGSGGSEGFQQTRGGAESMNAIPAGVLGMLARLRTVPPTTRTATSRIWGPFADEDRAGYEHQAEIHRETATLYTWAVKTRRVGERFTPVASGDAHANGDGQFALDLPGGHIEVRYATGGDPVIVVIRARAADGGSVDYAYNGWADGSGGLRFTVPDAGASARWSRTTAGRLDSAPWLVCWDARQATTYARFPTDAGVGELGDPASCIAPGTVIGIP